jgi:hypothetical protein
MTDEFWQYYNQNLDQNFVPTGMVLSDGTQYGRCNLCGKNAYLANRIDPTYPKVLPMWRHAHTGHTQCGTLKENGNGTVTFVRVTE